ncbi:MAG: hypothetical protein QOJ99_1768 [Bryobacterales bacterium]|nr:hypothetical protein [Bryobacterales bacterium]
MLAVISVASAQDKGWVEKSNENAQILIRLNAKYGPEGASSQGVPGLDDQISTFPADRSQRVRADTVKARDELKAKFDAEKDPLVRQDLQILIGVTERQIRGIDASEKTFLPHGSIANLIFFGEKSLLDDQVKAERRPAALVRLRKYTGVEPGFTPVTKQAEARFLEKAKTPGLLGPAKEEVEKDLQNTSTYITGIGLLLEKYKLQGYQEAFAKLREQLTEYDEFVRREVLPKARTDFRLPPAIYRTGLENYGVDYTPEELTRLAHAAFTDFQKQMQAIAVNVAKQRKLASSDYRDVIRELKKEQFSGNEILPKYDATLKQIEDIIRKNDLLTLPERPAIISIATAAETAQQPAPHMQPPPLAEQPWRARKVRAPARHKGRGRSRTQVR